MSRWRVDARVTDNVGDEDEGGGGKGVVEEVKR